MVTVNLGPNSVTLVSFLGQGRDILAVKGGSSGVGRGLGFGSLKAKKGQK
jgi:hypothetical protein